MRKNTESMVKGAALGMLAGSAVGLAGACAAAKKPREVRKMMKKAAAGAEKALETIEHTLGAKM